MTTDTVGGVFSYSIELARGLRARGARVILATMGGPLSADQREEAAGLTVHESGYRLEWMDDPWGDVERAGEWLLRIEDRERPDVVHLGGYAHGALPFRAPALVVAHSCVLSWYRAVRREDAPPRWDRYRREVTRGLAAASAVVAPTRAMRDAIHLHYGAGAAARVIPNARDPSLFRPGRKEPLVVAAGRIWDEAKNLAALGAAAPLLSWPVRVAGSDRSPGGERLCVPGALTLGVLSAREIANLLARASIYALPARYEPFGLSILEAALSGCALVLGDIPSLRELWGDDALFVDPDDTGDLAGALEGLIRRPAARRALGERARARALASSPDRMVNGYLDLYARMLDEPRPGCVTGRAPDTGWRRSSTPDLPSAKPGCS